jgi:putative nucleotidyltransferase with HDIG domain
MEGMLKRTNQDQILEEDFTVPGTERKNVGQRNILDFIAYDWEERNKDLEKSLRETLDANKRMDQLNWGTLKALARAIDAKSQWTAGHSEQVTRLALEVGLVLGLSQEEQTNLHQAALLHDIGKIGIPAELIDKPGKLTEEEYRSIREHPVIGARILEPIDAYAEIIPIVRQHHEWFNGNGYPDGLAGEAITLGARILAVVDVYDAISSQRPYRPGLEPDQALEVIKQKSGNHFDPVVVEAFLRVIEKDKKAAKQA